MKAKTLDVISRLWLGLSIVVSIVVGVKLADLISISYTYALIASLIMIVPSLPMFFALNALAVLLGASESQREELELLREQLEQNQAALLRMSAPVDDAMGSRPCPICGQPMQRGMCATCGMSADSRM